MNSTQARTRLLMLAQVCCEEAQQHPRGHTKAELTHCSIQLAYLARSVETQPVPVVEAFLERAIDLIVAIASSRSLTPGVRHG